MLYVLLYLFIHNTITLSISSCLGSAPVQGGEAASHPVQLMSLNLSRNVVAMEKALRHLAEAERSLEECSSCLVRDVIVSEAQAAEHNRSIGDAKTALLALREQLTQSHEEVSGHLQEAQLRFLQTKPLISLATGYTGYREISERKELDLSTLVYRTYETNNANWEDSVGDADATQTMIGASSSISQQLDGHLTAVNIEDSADSNLQVNSSLEVALRDDDAATIKAVSDDGHSYDGTVVRGGLKRDSE